jgi:predicted outer membrane repeat protein
MKRERRVSVGLSCVALVVLLASPVFAGRVLQILYVDARAPGANTGSSWENAFRCLQNALPAALGSGAEIRVAQGVYKPDRQAAVSRFGIEVRASGDRNGAFQLPLGATIKGGYAGYGTPNPDARDVEAYPSILSGDLAGNDTELKDLQPQSLREYALDPAKAENSYSVITVASADSRTTLDGFTITGGYADSSVYTRYPMGVYPYPNRGKDGAGVYISSGGATFIHCRFHRNVTLSSQGAGAGGAAVAVSSYGSPIFQECEFTENIAYADGATSYGAAIMNYSGSPALIDCTFRNNMAAGLDGQCWGGAIANFGGSLQATGCSFTGNMAMKSRGGAVYNNSMENPTFSGCTFEGNSADFGGGMYNSDGSSLTLTGCTFFKNEATGQGHGGAIFNGADSSPAVTGCRFIGNTAASDGGAISGAGSPRLANCLFSGNTARQGAGVFADVKAGLILSNSTFAMNHATEHGGALYGHQSTAAVTNCILWGDTPEEIFLLAGTADVRYSDVQDGWTGLSNVDSDPRLRDSLGADRVSGTLDDDLRLSLGSPAIDTGSSTATTLVTTTDLDGKQRVTNGHIDMGAYEFHGPYYYYVDALHGSDSNGGWSPREAFATIQKGINAAKNGYSVMVLPALYTQGIDFRGKAINVLGMGGAPVIETPRDYAVSFYSAEQPTSVLKNFVIRNSDVGIFMAGGSPTICNVTLAGNEFGIAAYAGANPSITNCILWGNTDGDLFGCTTRFSCVQQGSEGEGNISDDPLFADFAGGDYHLLSERGRYVAAYKLWSFDTQTSPCIDAGDPSLDMGAERMPNGGRIDMGAFGGTPEASMSDWPLAGDINRDGVVNFADLALLCQDWLKKLPGSQ